MLTTIAAAQAGQNNIIACLFPEHLLNTTDSNKTIGTAMGNNEGKTLYQRIWSRTREIRQASSADDNQINFLFCFHGNPSNGTIIPFLQDCG